MFSNVSTKHPFLTQTEVARICGVSSVTVWRWVDEGLLESVAFPTRRRPESGQRPFRRRVRQSDLVAFMAKHNISECPPGSPERSNRWAIRIPSVKATLKEEVSTRVVQTACGVKYRVAAKWIDDGVIPPCHESQGQFAAHRLVKRADLIAFMEARGYSPEALEIARTLN